MPDYTIEVIETQLVRTWYNVFDVKDGKEAYKRVLAGQGEHVESDTDDVVERVLASVTDMGPPTFRHDGEIVKVEWEDIGESIFGGEYNPDAPGDVPALRFSVYSLNPVRDSDGEIDGYEWEQMENASYCTLMPVGTTYKVLEWYSERILDIVGGRRELPPGGKRDLQWLTHIMVNEIRAKLEEESA